MKNFQNKIKNAKNKVQKSVKNVAKSPATLTAKMLGLIALMKLFAACEKDPMEKDQGPRTATVKVNSMFNAAAAKDSLNQIQDLEKLYALADGWWHHHDEETARGVMAWLANKMREVVAESEMVYGRNLVDGAGTLLNPKAINDEDREYLESLGFYVMLYQESHPCDPLKQEVRDLKEDTVRLAILARVDALNSALYVPVDVSNWYWNKFNGWADLPKETIVDSAAIHVLNIEDILENFPNIPNFENLMKLHGICDTLVKKCDTLNIKIPELEDCEAGGVGINQPTMKSGMSAYIPNDKNKNQKYASYHASAKFANHKNGNQKRFAVRDNAWGERAGNYKGKKIRKVSKNLLENDIFAV